MNKTTIFLISFTYFIFYLISSVVAGTWNIMEYTEGAKVVFGFTIGISTLGVIFAYAISTRESL